MANTPWPIDIGPMKFIGSTEPAQVLEYETKQPKVDANGELLFGMELICMMGTDKGSKVITVKFPGPPAPGIRQGVALKVSELSVADWEREGRHGLSFRASRVEPLNGTAAKAGGAS